MRIPSNKVRDVVQYFWDELATIYEHAEIEKFIQFCFEDFMGYARTDLIASHDKLIGETDLMKFHFAVKDLRGGRPIQYILGKAWFYGLELLVTNDVLIPRPETEELVRLIIDNTTANKESFSILDIGTGSGCIAISLKKNLPRCHVYALDVSVEALNVAKQNAIKNDCDIHFILADVLEQDFISKIPSCSIIVSNPPYVKKGEGMSMPKNVIDHEPHIALFVPDDNPLLFFKQISKIAKLKLKQGGAVYVELNEALGIETAILFQQQGFKDIQLLQDMQGKDRMIKATL